MKRNFYHGLVAGTLAALAGMVYNYAFTSAMLVDFSTVINPISISGACIFGAMLISVGYYFFSNWVTRSTDVWFNILLLVLTFATFASPFAYELPYELEFPELFPGLTIPMHLFPALFWLATKPLFYKSQ